MYGAKKVVEKLCFGDIPIIHAAKWAAIAIAIGIISEPPVGCVFISISLLVAIIILLLIGSFHHRQLLLDIIIVSGKRRLPGDAPFDRASDASDMCT